jgi:amidase
MNANPPLAWTTLAWIALAWIAFAPSGILPAARAAEKASDWRPGEEIPIRELQDDMAAGRVTSRQLVVHFLGRIQSIDREGMRINSVVEINPDVLGLAEAMDAERRKQGARGPLHGIPILLKDNIDTADQMLTTAGSLALVTSRPAEDAFIVKKLRDAGAVILGKTNLSEWANFRSRRSSSGWSARAGQTRNPYDVARNPCGSSSGSGAAIAANLAAAAVGTETDGSIVCPSAVNGIVGIKPTVGLVSRSGIIPISASQDTAGPMARSVEDAVLLLHAMIGMDARDPATHALNERSFKDSLIAALQPQGLRGARIGVARNLSTFHESVIPVLEASIDTLRAAGAQVIDPADLVMPKSMSEDEMTVLLYEFKDGVNRYLSTRTGGARTGAPATLADLIAFNEQQRAVELPFFGQELFIAAQAKGTLAAPEYVQARERSRRLAGPEGIDALLRKHRLDAIVAVSMGPAWTTDLVNGDRGQGGDITQLPAVAGYPHITVPAGFAHGLPIGISFVGTAWSDATLVRLAFAFEQATRARRPPVLLPERLAD